MERVPSVIDHLLALENCQLSTQTSFWNMKLKHSEKSTAYQLSGDQCLMSSYLFKRCSDLSLKKKWFFLSKTGDLFFKKKRSSRKVKGKVNLSNAIVQFREISITETGDRISQPLQPANQIIFGEENDQRDSILSEQDSYDCSSVLAQYDGDDAEERGLFSSCTKNSKKKVSSSIAKTIFEISFIKGLKFIRLTTYDQSEFLNWKYHLSQICLTEKLNQDLILTSFQNQELDHEKDSLLGPQLQNIVQTLQFVKETQIETYETFIDQSQEQVILDLHPSLKFDFSLLNPLDKSTLNFGNQMDNLEYSVHSEVLRKMYELLKGNHRPEILQVCEHSPYEIIVVFKPNCKNTVLLDYLEILRDSTSIRSSTSQ